MSYRLVLCCCFGRTVKIKQIKVKPEDKPVVYGYSKRYNKW